MTFILLIAATAVAVGGLVGAVRTARRVPRRNADFRWIEG